MAKRKIIFMSIYFYLPQLGGSGTLHKTQILHGLSTKVSLQVCFLGGTVPQVISLRKTDLEN